MTDWIKVEKKLKTFRMSKIPLKVKPEEIKIFRERNIQAINNFTISQKMLNNINWSSLSASQEALLKLTYILFITEGILAFYVNAISYSLVLNEHHDIWFERKQKFVSLFEELYLVPLSVKLKFLKIHGFEIFSEICSLDMRNAVAHQNFRIDTGGTIYIKNKKFTKQDSANKIEELTKLLTSLFETFKS